MLHVLTIGVLYTEHREAVMWHWLGLAWVYQCPCQSRHLGSVHGISHTIVASDPAASVHALSSLEHAFPAYHASCFPPLFPPTLKPPFSNIGGNQKVGGTIPSTISQLSHLTYL